MKFKTIFFLCSLAWAFSACESEPNAPDENSEEYKQAVSDFYVSLAASQTDEARFAFNKMNEVAQAFPMETAAWANLGVFAMRQGNYELAEERLAQARELHPENADVLFLSSMIESRRGNISQAISFLEEAISSDSTDIRFHFALAKELEREGDNANSDQIRRHLIQINRIAPDNQVVLLELARLAVKEEDLDALEQYINSLSDLSEQWNAQNREQLDVIKTLLDEQDLTSLNLELSFLRSGLEEQPEFRDDLLSVELPPTEVGFLITEFLWLPQPEAKAAEPDMDIQFTEEIPESGGQSVQWIKGVTLLEQAPPFPVTIRESEVVIDETNRLEYPGSDDQLLNVHVFTEIDYNYNFRNDIALVGSDGFKFYRQNQDETFTDITGSLGLSGTDINASYTSIWAFDIDMDGDLDLILSREDGVFLVFRNNGDDSFTSVEPFEDITNVTDMEWADMNGDGVPEAIFLTEENELLISYNLRGGQFDEPQLLAKNVAAITVADLNADGRFEIVAAKQNGEVNSVSTHERSGEWQEENVFSTELLPDQNSVLISADLDNNGAIDLLLSAEENSQIWLADSDYNFTQLETDLPGNIRSVLDINGNERLDLLGISEDGEAVQYMNSGTRDYFARSIRAQASGSLGDRRINSFGIGGEMEVRSGLLYQKQLITSPIVHFGLGEYEEAEMLRIIWPNGSTQAEFAEMGMQSTIFNEQILKGSCPWLFTNDGEEIQFITDILWRSPLGLRINAQETAGVVQTLDRVKVPGHQLKPVDGVYDLRITAELWETHFFDHVSLIAVDHPEDTEIFVDERFVIPGPDLSTRAMKKPQPVQSVHDEKGNDVTEVISEQDQNYLVPFTKTRYQGLVEEHHIEIDLGPSASDKPLWLVLSGWLRPTDSSINLALSQGSIDPPKGLKVEVANGEGGWTTVHDNYGFPAGKLKTILLDMEDIFVDSEDRRIRLHTTSEIYWDAIQWAEKAEASSIREIALEPTRMELRYRGYSEWSRADSTSPKLPYYDEISGTAPRWKDLSGFHTRFGDVSELLAEIDDRYVIMNAGDEMVVQFRAPEEPREGWVRSFVFVSDGWEKDGDYNTGASATVTPLPFHGQKDYEYSAGTSLKNDPIYQLHKKDWIHYHTRYITPELFNKTLSY